MENEYSMKNVVAIINLELHKVWANTYPFLRNIGLV
jgi:hypothetical protein